MDRSEFGAELVVYGVESHFKPWFFDGKTVYWGTAQTTKSAAMEVAFAMHEARLWALLDV
tara:strand:+ start:1436 stop:1615 length:180 start_codon:yes stop_codon:yes gene_type:complete